MADWAEQQRLHISLPKSSVTLFTSDTRQSNLHPPVTLYGTPLPLNRTPRILGITFDTHLTFKAHIQSIISRATLRLNILKALSGTTWGQQKETLIISYKSIIRSLFTYCAPIWFPNASPTSLNRIQSIQNAALRTATGNVKMASIGHLHAETQVLPVEPHLSLLCSPLHKTHPTIPVPSLCRPSSNRWYDATHKP